MKLYAFKPNGHGPFSFFVAAESEQEARAAVDKYGRKTVLYPGAYPNYGDKPNAETYEMNGWASGDYEVEEHAPGEVAVNAND